MSRSKRYTVRPAKDAGWFEIFDTSSQRVVTELRGKTDANRRCRKMNEIPDDSPAPSCSVAVKSSSISPWERDQIEQQIAWQETRERERQARIDEENERFREQFRPRAMNVMGCFD